MNKYIAGILFLLTFVIYLFFYTGEQKHLNYFVPLADAFLHFRLDVLEHPAWLNELIEVNGKYFVVYPPMPALLLMPIVLLFGTDFAQPLFSIFIGSINVVLCFIVVQKITKSRLIGIMIALLYAFGSMQFYHAVIGSAWYIAHIIAMFFLWLAMLFVIKEKRNYLLIGLLIGAAYWSRLPTILAVVFPLILYREDFVSFKPKVKVHFKRWILYSLGVGMFIVLNWLYNYARFGVIYDISYQLLPIFEEPWYQNGLFSLKNVPIHLAELAFAMPVFKNEWPYVIPSLNVLALWFVMPALLLILFAPFKKRIGWVLLLTILIMAIPGLMHGSNGFTQFGFRFSLDYLVFILLLISLSINRKKLLIPILLISLSIFINLWGMIYITLLKIWTM